MSNDSKKASSPRILVVDDSLLILTMLTKILTSEGYLVDAVETGFGALGNVSQVAVVRYVVPRRGGELRGSQEECPNKDYGGPPTGYPPTE